MANAPNPNANGGNGADGFVLVFYGACFGAIGGPYFALMGYGGLRMRNLSSRGWAMTGAIMGIASIVMCGVFCALEIGIGIWALTALLDPNVEAAFRLRREEHSRRRGNDREWGPDDS
jgi:hypothetical protein